MIRLCAFSDEASETLSGQISALQRNRIGYMELRSIAGKNVSNLTVEEAREYIKEIEDSGIKVWSIGSPLGKIDITVDMDKYTEKVKHVCTLANCFHTDKIRVFSFFNAYGEKNRVIDNLGRMMETAREFGVELYHENEKEIYGDVAGRVLELKQNLPELRLVYDPANYVQTGENLHNCLELLHDRSDYFHIKDVISATGELVPAGMGDGLLPELVERIKDNKVLSVEPHLAVFGAYSDIDKSEMKHKFIFKSNGEAFDAAVNGLKALLEQAGYREKSGVYEK